MYMHVIVSKLGFPISELCSYFWIMQHKVRLGNYKRDLESVEKEGENLQAVWSPDAKLIAILVSSFHWFDFFIWRVHMMIYSEFF